MVAVCCECRQCLFLFNWTKKLVFGFWGRFPKMRPIVVGIRSMRQKSMNFSRSDMKSCVETLRKFCGRHASSCETRCCWWSFGWKLPDDCIVSHCDGMLRQFNIFSVTKGCDVSRRIASRTVVTALHMLREFHTGMIRARFWWMVNRVSTSMADGRRNALQTLTSNWAFWSMPNRTVLIWQWPSPRLIVSYCTTASSPKILFRRIRAHQATRSDFSCTSQTRLSMSLFVRRQIPKQKQRNEEKTKMFVLSRFLCCLFECFHLSGTTTRRTATNLPRSKQQTTRQYSFNELELVDWW